MDITIYLPDALGAWAKKQKLNLSGMLRAEVEAEKERREARGKIAADGFERVEVRIEDPDLRYVAFQGRRIGYGDYMDSTVYLTPKGAIAMYSGDTLALYIYKDYAAFAAANSGEWVAEVAAALGERYVEELDI